MAGITDVSLAIAQIAEGAVYPNGTGAASIGACPIIIYPGWPDPQSIDADMIVGKVHVSIFPQPGDVVTSVMMGDTEWTELSRTGDTGVGGREVRRQTKQFQVTVWAPTPVLRDQIGDAIDLALGLANRNAMSDGTQMLLSYVRQLNDDGTQKVLIYRRDLFYAANYALLQTDPEFAIKQTITVITTAPSTTADPIDQALSDPAAIGKVITIISP